MNNIIRILFLSFLVSCQPKDSITINLVNVSLNDIKEIKLTLDTEHSQIVDTLITPGDSVSFPLDISDYSPKNENLFFIQYKLNDKAYGANFGYHSGRGTIKQHYDVYISEEGIKEQKKANSFSPAKRL